MGVEADFLRASHSLRRLVWTMQGHSTHVRAAGSTALAPEPDHIHQGQC